MQRKQPNICKSNPARPNVTKGMKRKTSHLFRRGQRVFIKPGLYYPGAPDLTSAQRTGTIHEILGGSGRQYGIRIIGHPNTVDYTEAELATSPWSESETLTQG
jgi:hypothetical protein